MPSSLLNAVSDLVARSSAALQALFQSMLVTEDDDKLLNVCNVELDPKLCQSLVSQNEPDIYRLIQVEIRALLVMLLMRQAELRYDDLKHHGVSVKDKSVDEICAALGELPVEILAFRRSFKDVDGDEAKLIRQECLEGSFGRSLQLPFEVDSTKVEASLKEGVLEITLPRRKEDVPKKLEIKVS